MQATTHSADAAELRPGQGCPQCRTENFTLASHDEGAGTLASLETCKLSRTPPEPTQHVSVQCRLYVNLSACTKPLAVLAGASPEHLQCQLLGSLRPPSSQYTNH